MRGKRPRPLPSMTPSCRGRGSIGSGRWARSNSEFLVRHSRERGNPAASGRKTRGPRDPAPAKAGAGTTLSLLCHSRVVLEQLLLLLLGERRRQELEAHRVRHRLFEAGQSLEPQVLFGKELIADVLGEGFGSGDPL